MKSPSLKLRPIWEAPHLFAWPVRFRGGMFVGEAFSYPLVLAEVGAAFGTVPSPIEIELRGHTETVGVIPVNSPLEYPEAIEELLAMGLGEMPYEPSRLTVISHLAVVRRLATRVGYAALAGLSEDIRKAPSVLTDPVGRRLAHGEPLASIEEAIPDRLLAQFIRDEAPAIGEWVRDTVYLFSVDLQRSAANRHRVEVAGLERSIAKLLREVDVPFRLSELRAPGRGGSRWSYGYETVRQRIALEFAQLVMERPTVARCSACRRVFVPRGNERTCAAHVWALHSRALVERCAPPVSRPLRSDYELWRERSRMQIRRKEERVQTLRAAGVSKARLQAEADELARLREQRTAEMERLTGSEKGHARGPKSGPGLVLPLTARD